MNKKYFKCVEEGAVYPWRSTEFSVGYDLTAASYTLDRDNNVVVYNTGVALGPDFPYSCFGDLRARSSIFRKEGWILVNGAGVIDPDYSDTIKFIYMNVDPTMPLEELPYLPGDRIGQLVIVPYMTEGDTVLTQRRGGHGSTGK